MIADMSSRPVDENIKELTRELKTLADGRDMSQDPQIEAILPLKVLADPNNPRYR